MSKCKLHKLLHIFPRRTENCFQIDANICGERKILQIAKRKLVWNSIFSRWFIGFIILFANFTEIWQSYFEIKNNFMLIKSEWKSRIKCCRNFRYFFFAAFAMKSRHIYLALINKIKIYERVDSNNFDISFQLKKNKNEMEILFEHLLA